MTDKKYAMALKETKSNEELLIGAKQVAIKLVLDTCPQPLAGVPTGVPTGTNWAMMSCDPLTPSPTVAKRRP